MKIQKKLLLELFNNFIPNVRMQALLRERKVQSDFSSNQLVFKLESLVLKNHYYLASQYKTSDLYVLNTFFSLAFLFNKNRIKNNKI